jgi:hypothetical protein
MREKKCMCVCVCMCVCTCVCVYVCMCVSSNRDTGEARDGGIKCPAVSMVHSCP